ncbi:MAG: tRNA preQ1(34) S-adenosylmethionine ribosyltransferase-isomerase QueA [Bacteroidales bacterium]|nr:tRNA preQ1(34) S-adenosylmethionine ribosyltransferase-isomerase QueA [Bacteroidales bacterium]
MKLSQFNFDLPPELVATHPQPDRDQSRLMVIDRKTQNIEHRTFKEVIEYFNDGDMFVTNDTKVFPARLYGYKEKTGARIEVFLLRELNRETRLWDVLVNPARKIRIGNKLYFGEDDELVAEVIDNTTSRGRTLRFLFDGPYEDFRAVIAKLGETPLPLQRDVEPEDKERYQTIFAQNEGGVAAPTAGMHFSRELIKRLEIKGIDFASITLHTGLGNFRNIEVEDLSKHKMDSEQMFISEHTANAVNAAKIKGQNIVAVGTTVMKAMESSVSISRELKPFEGWTNQFIFPPYEFNIANAMITNFHMPKSPMMMLAASYLDYDFLKEVYKIAIKEKYKFFTYGDAMLIK